MSACEHPAPAITETGDSVVGPDPLFTIACPCGVTILQVGHYNHPRPDSARAQAVRARSARPGTGYY